jgi:spore coat protein CotF
MQRQHCRIVAIILTAAMLEAPAKAQDLSNMPQCKQYFDRLEMHYRCSFAAPELKVLLEQSLSGVNTVRTEYALQSNDPQVRSLLEGHCKNLMETLEEVWKSCKR